MAAGETKMLLGTRRIADFPARGTVISAQVDSINSIVYDTTMPVPRIVLDTNVLVAALRSRRGVSFTLLSLIDSGRFEVHVEAFGLQVILPADLLRLIGALT